ncbi:MAG: serine/threonine protein kinase [Thermoanaerobaculia bacterium]
MAGRLSMGKSILVRAVAALLIVGLVPLLFTAYRLIGINKHGMEDQVLLTHTVAARTAGERIDSFIEAWRARCNAVSMNEIVLSDARSSEASEILQSLLGGDANLAAVEIFDPSGHRVIAVRSREFKSDLQPWFGRPILGDIEIGGRGNERWLIVSSRLPDSLATVQMIVDARTIDQVLVGAELGPQAELGLIDRNGAIVAPQGRSIEAFPPDLVAFGKSATFVGAGEFGTPETGRVLGAYYPLPSRGWAVLSRQPIDIAQAVDRKMRREARTSLVLSVGLTALLTGLAYAQFVRPIRQLVVAQRKLAGGSSAASGGGGSEIQQLQNTFEMIERRIRDQEDLGRVFVGRYQVLGLLGRGGMGVVFHGFDSRLERHVALKVVRTSDSVKPDERDELITALKREAITIAKFNHPNVVNVYDVEGEGGTAYIAMELVEGLSLERYLARRKRVPWMEALVIGFATTKAIAAAHESGIVHHDIKPGNVLLGKDGSIKVTDFGISRPISSGPQRTDVVFGSPSYLSPEACLGRRMGPEGDIFAVGITLYEIMIGINPFRRSTVGATIRATIDEPVPELAGKLEAIDPQFSALVAAMLEKEPEKRPRSAAEIADRLGEIVRRTGARWEFPAALLAKQGASKLQTPEPPTAPS